MRFSNSWAKASTMNSWWSLPRRLPGKTIVHGLITPSAWNLQISPKVLTVPCLYGMHTSAIKRTSNLNHWLLLCHAMDCSETPDQITGIDTHHVAIGE